MGELKSDIQTDFKDAEVINSTWNYFHGIWALK